MDIWVEGVDWTKTSGDILTPQLEQGFTKEATKTPATKKRTREKQEGQKETEWRREPAMNQIELAENQREARRQEKQ